jgi:signal transduction histidine kinase/streptogramin lyase
MIRTIARSLGLALLVVLVTGAAPPSHRSLEQMKHTRWTTDDAAPAGIQALAQTQDGFLWIGSSTGLYRFDGKTFERVATIGSEVSVTALLATRDGRLLIGLQNGHLLLLRQGRETDVTPSRRAKRIRNIAEDAFGGIWLQTSAPDLEVVQYLNGHWTHYGPGRGLPDDSVNSVVADHDGSVWASTAHAIYVHRSGAETFVPVAQAPALYVDSLFSDPGGHVWAASAARGFWQVSPVAGEFNSSAALVDTKQSYDHVLVDRAGAIWASVATRGIVRLTSFGADIRAKARVERYGAALGLSSDTATAVLEDREGTIWIGTSAGLDRFRPANVVLETAIPAQSANGYILFSDSRGTIYAADSDTLYQVRPGGSPTAVIRNINNPMGVCEGADGDIWVADNKTFYVLHDGQVRRETTPPAKSYMRCQSDSEHAPWFLAFAGSIFRRSAGGWIEERPSDQQARVTNFTFDAQGRPVYFYENRGLLRQDGHALTMLWPADRIPGGRISMVHLGSSGMLASGVTGLARIRGGDVDLLGASYPWLQHVTGLVETAQGETWVQSSLGIYRLPTSELQRAFDQPGRELHPASFDALDGLRGLNLLDYADNGAAVGGDGRIWFATTDGIVWIDPGHLHRNRRSPPVAITRVVADGRSLDASATVKLARGTANLEIDYTALSLAMPERVAFRYRLEGLDDRWIDPGLRRQAFYAKLAPGSYRFTVIAANEDGVWNRTGASIKITLPPTFTQSWLFKLLCVGGALLVLLALYRARLERITHRLRAQLDARLAERERIARELHDTLLQGVQGLILRFQGIADRLPHDQVLGRLMEKALERAEELLLEGRERVHGLRSNIPHGDMRSSLFRLVDDAVLPAGLSGTVSEVGRTRAIDASVQEELIGIAREALSNVVRHSHATSVEITVSHGWRSLMLTITDNGRGIGPDQLPAHDGRHFGIAGMHERARRIGGLLHLGDRAGGGGTRLTVRVPAGIAYPSSRLHLIRSIFGFSTADALA